MKVAIINDSQLKIVNIVKANSIEDIQVVEPLQAIEALPWMAPNKTYTLDGEDRIEDKPIIPLPELQSLAWEQLKNLRSQKNSEPLELNGEVFDADTEGWDNIKDALKRLDLPNPPESRPWKLANNSISTMTPAKVKSLVAEKIDRKDVLHTAAEIVRAMILASTDPASLDVETLYNNKITELSN